MKYIGPPLRVEYDHDRDVLIIDGLEYNGEPYRAKAASRHAACIECGAEFVQRDRREKFCRPSGTSRASRCAMRYRKREQRRRQKAAA